MGGTHIPSRAERSFLAIGKSFFHLHFMQNTHTHTPSGARNHIIMLQYLLHTTARRINYVHLGVWNVPQKNRNHFYVGKH